MMTLCQATLHKHKTINGKEGLGQPDFQRKVREYLEIEKKDMT